MEVRKKIGERIAMLRKEKGWTLNDLSQASGINTSNLSRIERGIINVGVDMLGNIAKALGCNIALLADDEIRRYHVVVTLTDGRVADSNVAALDEDEALDRLVGNDKFLAFLDGASVKDAKIEEVPYVAVEKERFTLQKSNMKEDVWVCTDLQNMWVCTFEQGKFRETQHFTDLKDEGDTDALKVATIMREFGEWLSDNYGNLI